MKSTHALTDKVLRDKLAELSLAHPTETGWAALSESLDADPDTALRAALIGLATTAAPAGWEALERKLDPRAPTDVRLAEQLNSLEPTLATGSWAVLSDRIDKEKDDAVDAIVANGLRREVGGVASGWAALAARLELIGWRRGTVAAWKITEGALLMSLLLLFLRFGPQTEPAPLPVLADVSTSFPLAEMTATTTTRLPETSTAAPGEAATRPAAQSPIVQNKRSADRPTRAAANVPLMLPTVSAPAVKAVALTAGPLTARAHPRVAMLDVQALVTPPTRLPSPMLDLPVIDGAEPVYYYLNTFLSPADVNQVVTPSKGFTALRVNGGSRFTAGQSGGFLLDVAKGKDELQFGVIVSRRSYVPTVFAWRASAPVDLKGYTRFNYTSIELPLNYKRVLHQTNNWRFSGRVGMSMHVTAFSDFEGRDKFNKTVDEVEQNLARMPVPTPRSTTSISDKRQLENPSAGWFEGGGIFDNASFYVGGGIVVERLLTPRMSVYVSPSFGRVVFLREGQGTGPTNDRIHSGGLRLGSRYLFGGM